VHVHRNSISRPVSLAAWALGDDAVVIANGMPIQSVVRAVSKQLMGRELFGGWNEWVWIEAYRFQSLVKISATDYCTVSVTGMLCESVPDVPMIVRV
jgi:hypothetical protein